MFECRCRLRMSADFDIDVDFRSDARVIALFGPSGSGKTTLLNAIAGLQKPDSARIVSSGRILIDTSQSIALAPESRRIGYVFQDLRLFPHLSVEANLCFGARRDSQPVRHLAADLKLSHLLGRRPDQLSGGERQRVALGRALMRRPDLLLLDEPLGSLDDPLKIQALGHIERAIAAYRIPTVFVSHSQAEVRRLADWVVVLQGGKVVAQGAPEEALAAAAPLSMTEETQPMNLLRIEEVRELEGARQARIGAQWLLLPASAPADAPRYIAFAPGAVMLATHDIGEISARNHLRAVVVRSVELAGAVFVEVDAGQRFWAAITPASAREMRIAEGMTLLCLIKTQSLIIS